MNFVNYHFALLAPRKRMAFRPGALVSFFLFAPILVHLLAMDRSGLMDNENYIDYFRWSGIDYWRSLFSFEDGLVAWLASLVAEEVGWRIWTSLVSLVFEPAAAVYFTVIFANVLFFAAAQRMDRPWVAVILWAIIPTGLSVVGLYQVRQGLAFSIFLYGMTGRFPGSWSVVSCLVHTSLVAPVAFFCSWKIFGRNMAAFSLIVIFLMAVAAALLGDYFFLNYGGRRLSEYAYEDGASSIFFAVGATIFGVCYFFNFIRFSSSVADFYLAACSIAGAGLCAFLVASFFLFPLGTMRIGYFQALLCIPLLAHRDAFWIGGKLRSVHVGNAMVLLFIFYQAVKEFVAGNYNFLLGG